MKKVIVFVLTCVLLFSYNGNIVNAEEVSENEVIGESESTEVKFSESTEPTENVTAETTETVEVESSESAEIIEDETTETEVITERDPSETAENIGDGPAGDTENLQPEEEEEEEIPLLTIDSSTDGNSIDQYDVQVSWTITEGEFSIRSEYSWNPDHLRYEKCGQNISVTTAPGAEITIQNNSDKTIEYLIEPQFLRDFGEQPQSIVGTVDVGSTEVISSSLSITNVPDDFDGSETIATYKISVFKTDYEGE